MTSDEPGRWPALMDRATAAAYLKMSPRSAERLLLRNDVRPLPLGLRLRRWRKADIDLLLACGGRAPPDPSVPEFSQEVVGALEAVARRCRKEPRTGRPPHP